MKLTNEAITRFESKYDQGTEDECWEFPDSSFSYRQKNVRRKSYAPYRIAWQAANGNQEIPVGKMICHHCDNPPCVNPKHLYLGDGFTNNQDTVNRGRARRIEGEDCSWSKLTEENVTEIRLSEERQKILAAKFGVSPSHISRIKSGDRNMWKRLS